MLEERLTRGFSAPTFVDGKLSATWRRLTTSASWSECEDGEWQSEELACKEDGIAAAVVCVATCLLGVNWPPIDIGLGGVSFTAEFFFCGITFDSLKYWAQLCSIKEKPNKEAKSKIRGKNINFSCFHIKVIENPTPHLSQPSTQLIWLHAECMRLGGFCPSPASTSEAALRRYLSVSLSRLWIRTYTSHPLALLLFAACGLIQYAIANFVVWMEGSEFAFKSCDYLWGIQSHINCRFVWSHQRLDQLFNVNPEPSITKTSCGQCNPYNITCRRRGRQKEKECARRDVAAIS